ncbi:MAG: hypothetical protein N2746_08850 [Deltaproteobacteria bacterium]|nr:hypothetical protein [Deltaproteobacteria bacterium]
MFNDEERERPSWREIDRRKDRSKFVREDKPQYQSKKSKSIIANYKHKLKEAFRTGKVAEAIDKLEGDTVEKSKKRENMKILTTSEDLSKFTKALEWYLEQNYEEIDIDIINRALNFDKEELTIKVLTALRSKRNLKEVLKAKNIIEKLNLIQMTAKSLQLRHLIKELLVLGD